MIDSNVLQLGVTYYTHQATVHVKNVGRNVTTYGVTFNDGEYANVFRYPDGRLIGYPWFVGEVITATEREWAAIQCGARH